jgi:hypothetical protein
LNGIKCKRRRDEIESCNKNAVLVEERRTDDVFKKVKLKQKENVCYNYKRTDERGKRTDRTWVMKSI